MAKYSTFEGPDGGPYDAIRFTGNFDDIEKFVGGDAAFRGGELVVATPQGALTASNGDWIVRDARGRFFTEPDIYMRSQYQLVR